MIKVVTAPHNIYYFHARATVIASIGWITGGGWCGILGYFFLEKLGWRWFVLSTSIPLFIPSIIAFQFILSDAAANTDNTDSTDGAAANTDNTDSTEGTMVHLVLLKRRC